LLACIREDVQAIRQALEAKIPKLTREQLAEREELSRQVRAERRALEPSGIGGRPRNARSGRSGVRRGQARA
jgi:hypothetical protein